MLDGTSTCHDQQVCTNTILYLSFKKPGTKDEFEDLKEVAGQEFEYDFPGGPRKKVEEAPKDD